MHVLKKTLSLTVAASVLGLASPALADATIGFIGGFTGPIESLTPPIADATQLAVDHVNEQGGILGGTLSIVTADDGCSGDLGASAGDRVVNADQVTAIVGALCSGATIAAANTAAIPGNVVMVSPASTAPALTTLDDNDLVFRTTPSDAFQGEVMARMLLARGIDEIVVTYVNNDYGAGFAEALVTAYEAGGGTVAASESHEEGRADYRAEIGSLAATGVQNLVILAYASGSGQTLLRQATEGGDFALYVGGDGMVGDDLLTGIDAGAVEGMIATRPGTPDLPGSEIYAELAEAAGQDPTATFAPQAYDAAFLLALAIEYNGTADREGLSAALREVASAPGEVILPGEWEKAVELIAAGEAINYEGASGSHEFDEVGDVPGFFVELAVEGGSFVEVGPLE